MTNCANISYEEMVQNYNMYSLGYMGTDINSKFAVISLVGYLTFVLRKKKPDVTCYQVIKKIVGEGLPEDIIKGLSIVCSDFAYGCEQFPTFGLSDKDIPKKVREILLNSLPF